RTLVGFWKSAAVRAFSVEIVAPIGKVGWIRSRYMRLPPSSTIAMEPPSLPFFASAAAAAAITLAPSSVRVFFAWVACAWAWPTDAISASATRSEPVVCMIFCSSAWGERLGDGPSNARSGELVPEPPQEGGGTGEKQEARSEE